MATGVGLDMPDPCSNAQGERGTPDHPNRVDQTRVRDLVQTHEGLRAVDLRLSGRDIEPNDVTDPGATKKGMPR